MSLCRLPGEEMRQQILFIVARSDTKFQRETLRRGGPYEVQGKKWRKRLREAEEMGEGGWEKLVEPPRLGKMP